MTRKQLNNLTTLQAIEAIKKLGSKEDKAAIQKFDTPESDIRAVGRRVIKKSKNYC